MSSITCIVCTKSVLENDKALVCDGFCGQWVHAVCINVTDKQYATLKALKAMQWWCKPCRASFRDKNVENGASSLWLQTIKLTDANVLENIREQKMATRNLKELSVEQC